MNVQSKKRHDGSARRGRPLVDDKRRRILDAALRTFSERGYHGTAVPEVAAAAKVSTGTLYHYFASKEVLVNEVYRDAKQRLKVALLDGMPALDTYRLDHGQAWFAALWSRLAAFAEAEPEAFRFLEMQDHVPYLDAESRALEVSVLAPLWLAGTRLVGSGRAEHAAAAHGARGASGAAASANGLPIDVAIALLWGAFVGVIKASRLGYIQLDAHRLEQAGAACWRMIAPAPSRVTAGKFEPASASTASRSRPAPPASATTSSRNPRTTSSTSPRTTSSRSPRTTSSRSPRTTSSRSPRTTSSTSSGTTSSTSPRTTSSTSSGTTSSTSSGTTSSRSPRTTSSRSPRTTKG